MAHDKIRNGNGKNERQMRRGEEHTGGKQIRGILRTE
jgi:hypothetical protein